MAAHPTIIQVLIMVAERWFNGIHGVNEVLNVVGAQFIEGSEEKRKTKAEKQGENGRLGRVRGEPAVRVVQGGARDVAVGATAPAVTGGLGGGTAASAEGECRENHHPSHRGWLPDEG